MAKISSSQCFDKARFGQKSRAEPLDSEAYVVVGPPPEALASGRIDLESPVKVSLCILTFNSQETLAACLTSIVCHDYPNTK